MSAAAWAVLSSVRAETEASPGPLSNQRGENCTCRAGQASKAGDRGFYIKSQYPSTSLPLSNYLPFGCSLCSSLLLSSPPLRWGYWSWMSPHLSDVEELLCCSFSDTHSPRSQKSLSSLLLLSLPSPLLPLPYPLPPSLPLLPSPTTYPGLSLLLPRKHFSPSLHPVMNIPSPPICWFTHVTQPWRSKHEQDPALLKRLQGIATSKYARNVKIKNSLLRLSWGRGSPFVFLFFLLLFEGWF